jgi:hypothetical protein
MRAFPESAPSRIVFGDPPHRRKWDGVHGLGGELRVGDFKDWMVIAGEVGVVKGGVGFIGEKLVGGVGLTRCGPLPGWGSDGGGVGILGCPATLQATYLEQPRPRATGGGRGPGLHPMAGVGVAHPATDSGHLGWTETDGPPGSTV